MDILSAQLLFFSFVFSYGTFYTISFSLTFCSSARTYNFIYFFNSGRGPSYGFRGKVVLAFEDNESSKIGVRFDKSIPDGNDLGGHIEDDHGFFCSGILFFYLFWYSIFLLNMFP